MSADAGTWNGKQVRQAEAGGWWVWKRYRWVALRTRRGGEEQVKNKSASEMNGYI